MISAVTRKKHQPREKRLALSLVAAILLYVVCVILSKSPWYSAWQYRLLLGRDFSLGLMLGLSLSLLFLKEKKLLKIGFAALVLLEAFLCFWFHFASNIGTLPLSSLAMEMGGNVLAMIITGLTKR